MLNTSRYTNLMQRQKKTLASVRMKKMHGILESISSNGSFNKNENDDQIPN